MIISLTGFGRKQRCEAVVKEEPSEGSEDVLRGLKTSLDTHATGGDLPRGLNARVTVATREKVSGFVITLLRLNDRDFSSMGFGN